MMKKTYAFLAVTLMLTTAAPVAAPAMPVQAESFVRAEQTITSIAGNTASKFVQQNGKTYCLKSDGSKKTGWVQEAGKWYYFDKSDGHMLTGWMVAGTKKYYLRTNGSMVSGPGWYMISGKKYYFTKSGYVRAAWEKLGGKWYYRNTSGNLVKCRWVYYGGGDYYLKKDGAAATGTVTINGCKYTFSSNGDLLGTVPASVAASAKTFARDEANAIQKLKASLEAKNKAQSKNTESNTNTNTTAKDTASSSKTTANTAKKAASSASSAAITKVVGKLNNLPESKKNFAINIAKYVRKYAPKYGIKVYSPIIAQAIHESGWGESSLAWKYHNYFGMKCGTAWTGKSVNLSTKEEYTAGTLTTIRDNFRVYDNMEQGVKGYFEFISKPRYANLKGVTSPRQYLQNIKNDGYATGSQYVDHTMAVVDIYSLTQFDK